MFTCETVEECWTHVETCVEGVLNTYWQGHGSDMTRTRVIFKI